MAKRRKLSNPLALAVMVFLNERPMHPYEIARLLRQRGKQYSIKINYGSLYTVVQNLEKHGFVEVAGVQRQGNRPERTLYGLTDPGRVEMHDWLADLVAVPAREYPSFEAALSLVGALHPDEVTELLDERLRALDVHAAALRGVLGRLDAELPRLFVIESEYQLHMVEAEAGWVRALHRELADGTLPGAAEWRSWHETGEVPERWSRLEEDFRDVDAAELMQQHLDRAAEAAAAPEAATAEQPATSRAQAGEPGGGRPRRDHP